MKESITIRFIWPDIVFDVSYFQQTFDIDCHNYVWHVLGAVRFWIVRCLYYYRPHRPHPNSCDSSQHENTDLTCGFIKTIDQHIPDLAGCPFVWNARGNAPASVI